MKKIVIVVLFLIGITIFSYADNKNHTEYRNAIVMAYSPANNVYEDENIKFEIYNEGLYATNKTDKTIFLDLSQCFLVHNGSLYPMFEEAQNEKHASKSKESTSIEEFLSIPPSIGSKQNETYICQVAGGFFGKYTTSESPSRSFSEWEKRFRTVINEMLNESLEADPKGKEYIGTSYRHLTEDESVNNIGATVAYAFNKRSQDWTPVTISTWVSDIYFAPYYIEIPKGLKEDERRGFGVKNYDAAIIHVKADSPFEFDNENSPVLVGDWYGDFKKGEFEIAPTWIPKYKKKTKWLKDILSWSFNGNISNIDKTNPIETYYKRKLSFDGMNDDWGKMKYMNKKNLSEFKWKRN